MSGTSRLLALCVVASAALLPGNIAWGGAAPTAKAGGCTTPSCHQGIEDIRGRSSPMMRNILGIGSSVGDPDGCVVCHGGNLEADTAEEAHRGAPAKFVAADGPKAFYPDPGSPWVNENTCGMCHGELVRVQWNSLMMTEAGKIQGTSWSFGALQGYRHGWGNYDAENPKDTASRRGSEAYRAYMEALKEREPGAFPDSMKSVPEAPQDLSVLKEHPELSVFTYIRTECERCHWAVRGRERRGDYRGMGCSACHIPYGNEGLYEGKDPSIPRDKPRHLLVHRIQSTREAKVTVHETTYSGIPVETCTTCHDRGKRIGVSFQGLMESPFASPFTQGGSEQPELHSKHYLAMTQDVHYQKGMLCQDCHTSIDVHGDGFLAGTNLAQVEIECADCHGTPWAYPWELPLGYGDEYDVQPRKGPARGTAPAVPDQRRKGTVYPPADGYLLTARGNPFVEVVRKENRVVVHTAGGKDIELKPLKLLAEERALETGGVVAMKEIGLHLEKMECYACHSSWAPQCYGCHVKIDYSGGKTAFDWVKAGHLHEKPEHAADAGENGYAAAIPGEVTESRSYMRFEDPALGVNGEGRVSPVVPGCQPSVTVVGPGGETLLLNHVFRAKPGAEGGGEEGQLCIDMSPAQPHTTGRARTCESCHASEKALGYGIAGGRVFRGWDKTVTVDLKTADGKVLPRSARPQMEAIDGLVADWSRFVTEDGKQLQTVGHHFRLSRPLDNEERAHMSREGICLSCHREIPSRSVAVSLLHHAAEAGGMLPWTTEEHDALVNKTLLMTAWVQVGGAACASVFGLAVILWFLHRRYRKRREKRN